MRDPVSPIILAARAANIAAVSAAAAAEAAALTPEAVAEPAGSLGLASPGLRPFGAAFAPPPAALAPAAVVGMKLMVVPIGGPIVTGIIKGLPVPPPAPAEVLPAVGALVRVTIAAPAEDGAPVDVTAPGGTATSVALAGMHTGPWYVHTILYPGGATRGMVIATGAPPPLPPPGVALEVVVTVLPTAAVPLLPDVVMTAGRGIPTGTPPGKARVASMADVVALVSAEDAMVCTVGILA